MEGCFERQENPRAPNRKPGTPHPPATERILPGDLAIQRQLDSPRGTGQEAGSGFDGAADQVICGRDFRRASASPEAEAEHQKTSSVPFHCFTPKFRRGGWVQLGLRPIAQRIADDSPRMLKLLAGQFQPEWPHA